MATLDTTKDETVATEDPSEEAKAEQSASNFESQDTSSRDVPQVDENVENPEEFQAPSSPPDTEPLQGTALKKPTFMRVAREHISPEVLDKHSIPYIDDPDPSFLLITQWLPEAQLEQFWMESSVGEDSSKSQHRPLASLTPIRETRGSSESLPRTPTTISAQNSPSYSQTLRQKSVEIISGYPSPGPSAEVKQAASLRHRDHGRGKLPGADQWEDIDEKIEPGRVSKGKRSIRSSRSVGDREQSRQINRKMKRLAWEKRIDNEGTFNSFGQLQLLLLFHAQHDLVLQLESFDDEEEESREQIRSQLHRYIESLQDYKWTQTLPSVPWRQASNHLKGINATFSDFESAYRNPYVSDSRSLVDIGRRSTSDPLRKALTRFLPQRLTIDDPIQAEVLTQMRDLDFTEDEMPLKNVSSSLFVTNTARFLVALLGGLFLLIPMLIINFVSSQHMRLLVTSLFVVAFATFLSSLKKASSLEILSGTAAYTAVLVIFVGKSGVNA